jgi:hypothetical protein
MSLFVVASVPPSMFPVVVSDVAEVALLLYYNLPVLCWLTRRFFRFIIFGRIQKSY